ncbi:MAG: hypothetical protein ACTIBG_08785 [Brevibacterium aurantiacum]|uniref:hypothetical protein n=1 Tax=Brevibacterium aurantiacum TaxID=273384 RepID=UPI003F929819
MVEHHCRTQTMTTDTIFANGSLRVITSKRDWRTDEFRRELPEITVSMPDRRVVSTIKGTAEDLKVLGEFITRQAKRFEAILNSEAGVSATPPPKGAASCAPAKNRSSAPPRHSTQNFMKP